MLSKILIFHFFGKIDAIRQLGLHPLGQQLAGAPSAGPSGREPVLPCPPWFPQSRALFTLRALHPFKVQICIGGASSKSFCTSLLH